MTLTLDDLDLLAPDASPVPGTPMRVSIALIDEDPAQPRQEFDDASLAELAATIRERGVRQPVSVRAHPDHPGRWMLNFGARRLRASKLAELTEIPAFVDQTAQSVDQFIENEQRKGLTPLEIALFVQRAMEQGQTQAEIARSIGKSRQYVMTATALIDPPEWLMTAYREGRCRGLHELHECRKLHAAHPQRFEALTADQQLLSRERLASIRAQLEQEANRQREACPANPAVDALPVQTPPLPQPHEPTAMAAPAPDTPIETPPPPQPPLSVSQVRVTTRSPRTPDLLASLDGERVRILIHSIPDAEGHVYVQPMNTDASRQAVPASRLTLIGFGHG
jgi:ParB family chromosome partitioning protein